VPQLHHGESGEPLQALFDLEVPRADALEEFLQLRPVQICSSIGGEYTDPRLRKECRIVPLPRGLPSGGSFREKGCSDFGLLESRGRGWIAGDPPRLQSSPCGSTARSLFMHKLSMLTSVLLFAGWLGSCSSAPITHGTGKIEVAGITKMEWEMEGRDPGRTLDITSESSDLLGRTVCVQFTQEGRPLGAPAQLTIPCWDVPLPAGADRADVGEGDCGGKGGGRFGLPVPGIDRLRPVSRWEFFGMPVGAEGSDYRRPQLTYSVEIGARCKSEAGRIRDRLVERGFEERVPQGTEVRQWSYFWIDLANREVVIELGETDPFEAIALDINRTPFATLDDAVVTQRNGWTIARFAIPLHDPIFNGGLAPGEYVNSYKVMTWVEGPLGLEQVDAESEWTCEIPR
jgi:hypothetical protein